MPTEGARPKPGHKTTEFWVALAAIAVPALTVLATATTGPIAIAAACLAAGLSGGAYSLSRGRVKAAALGAPPWPGRAVGGEP